MDITLFIIIFVFAITILLLGFFKKQIVIILFSGIAFFMLGIFCLNGIEYVSSSTIQTMNNSVSIVTNNYSSWIHTFGSSNITYTSVLGILFCLFGLFLFIVCAVLTFTGKANIDFSEDGDIDGDD